MNEYTGLHPVLGYFAPSGLGGLVWIWGIEPGKNEGADGRTKFDNARETCANTPNREGWGWFGAGINEFNAIA